MKNNSMLRKAVAFAFVAMMLCLPACQSDQEAIYSKYTEESSQPAESRPVESGAAETAPKKDLSGTLTLYTVTDIAYRQLMDAFMEKYPGVTIEYVGPSALPAIQEYSEQTTVLLTSGECADIVDMTWLPYFRYANSGLFEDLYPYMETDPEFSFDDYYLNIFEALEFEDKLCGVPPSFRLWGFRLNETLLENAGLDAADYETLNAEELIEIYHQVEKHYTGADTLYLHPGWGQYLLYQNEFPAYLDERSEEASFESAAFIKYLTDTAGIPWPEDSASVYIDEENIWENQLLQPVNIDCVSGNLAKDIAGQSQLILQTNSKGQVTFQSGPLGIYSGSKNKELAWEFIKFCLQGIDYTFSSNPEEGQLEYLLDGCPVNRKITLELLGKRYDDETVIEKFDAWNLLASQPDMRCNSTALAETLEEIVEEYYAGLISADACAQKLQDRAYIYLRE